jgi:hypothetical protein
MTQINVIEDELKGKLQRWIISLIKLHYFLDGNCTDERKLMTLEPKITSKNRGSSSSLNYNFSKILQ